MRIVLDTNVLVAGLLSPYGPPGEIVRMVSSGELTLCFDPRVLSEYAGVLRRPKFGFDKDAVPHCSTMWNVEVSWLRRRHEHPHVPVLYFSGTQTQVHIGPSASGSHGGDMVSTGLKSELELRAEIPIILVKRVGKNICR